MENATIPSLDSAVPPETVAAASAAGDELLELLPVVEDVMTRAEAAYKRYCTDMLGHPLTDDEFDLACPVSTLGRLEGLRSLILNTVAPGRCPVSAGALDEYWAMWVGTDRGAA